MTIKECNKELDALTKELNSRAEDCEMALRTAKFLSEQADILVASTKDKCFSDSETDLYVKKAESLMGRIDFEYRSVIKHKDRLDEIKNRMLVLKMLVDTGMLEDTNNE